MSKRSKTKAPRRDSGDGAGGHQGGRVVIGMIALNEADLIARNIRQHRWICDRFIIVEGCVEGFPTDRVSSEGLSTDGMAGQISAGVKTSEGGGMWHIEYGWAKNKSALRQAYAMFLDPGDILVAIDADEFYRKEELQQLVDTVRSRPEHVFTVQPIQHYRGLNQVVRGGMFNNRHSRAFRWVEGAYYSGELDRGIPMCGEGELSARGVLHTPVTHHHVGYARPDYIVREKDTYYEWRGDHEIRPQYKVDRQAWFDGNKTGRLKIQSYRGPLPEQLCGWG